MSVSSVTLEAYLSLGIGEIPSDWVTQVWSDNFCETVPLSGEDGGDLFKEENWRAVVSATAKWLHGSEGEGQLYTVLAEGGISYKSVIAVIFSMVDKMKGTFNDTCLATLAANLYLLLLQIPGSGGFKVFHPMVFQRVIESLHLNPEYEKSIAQQQQRKKQQEQSKKTTKGKRKRRAAAAALLVEEESMDTEEISHSQSTTKDLSLSEQEQVHVHKLTVEAAKASLLCLEKVSLRDEELSRQQAVSVLVKMIACDMCPEADLDFISVIESPRVNENRLSLLGWRCLHVLCQPFHGDRERLIAEVFRQLLPVILMLTDESSKVGPGVIPPALATVAHQAVRFVGYIVRQGKEHAHQPMRALVQHVCFNTSDKAEYRNRLAKLTTLLLGYVCEDSLYASMLHWLYKFSRNTKVSFRLFALDVISQLMSLSLREVNDGEEAISHAELMLPMIRRRTSDDKVIVRKAAIQALEALVRLDLNHIRKEDVQIFHDHCMDPALSVRKQALTSLNSLTIDAPTCTILHSLWLDGVMPMVMDKEISVQEKCFLLLEEFLLSLISPYTDLPSEMEKFVWQLFDVIASDEDLQRYFKKACHYWTKQKKITSLLIENIMSHAISTDHCKSAWMILEIVATFASYLVDEMAVICFWQQCVSQSGDTPVDTGVLRRVLTILGCVTNKMSQQQLKSLQEQLERLLLGFELDYLATGAAIDTMEKIIRSQYPNNQAAATNVINKWSLPLIKSCENYLSSVVVEQPTEPTPSDRTWTEDSLIKHLFMLGEVAQLCPSHISHHLCLMIQSMLLAAANHGRGDDSQKIQTLTLSPPVIAHGYITLGKLCLQHLELVEKSVVQMAMELEQSEHPVIRNNIIVVLCDLMVRYSSKVDLYVPKISACLKDESVLVRKQTLTLLTHLLQEDYVKWKDSLFFRFLSTLVDDELKRYAEFCLLHLVTSKHPTVFYQHFVECIFFYNNYDKHKVYNKFKEPSRIRELFSLKGSMNVDKRRELYQFMLKHMTDEQKFQLSAKLCQEVLGAMVDNILPFDDATFPLIRDALFVLASKDIKLSSFQSEAVEEFEDEGDMMGAAVAAARNKLISQIVKKNVIENIVPIVVSIKHMFEKAHSPLLKDLMLYLKELMKDYRTDVADILAGDKQLAEEIEFDLRRFEEEQKKAAAKGQTPAVITPHTKVVSPLLPPAELHTPPTQQGAPVAITATPMATPHPAITPAAKAALANFITPKTRTPQKQQTAPSGSVRIQSVNKAVLAASAKRSARKSAATASRITPRAIISRMQAPSLPPPKPSTGMGDGENETLLMPTKSGDRIASTPGGLAETISFNISSIVPPSPIAAALFQDKLQEGTQPKDGGGSSSKRSRSEESSTQININFDEPMKSTKPMKVTFA
ncbi:condensin-2 complex subunit D3-L-like isoform X3 [Dysidea avara]|uniref:condensin-2 complex subunit D3-L-like isoform X3 n=1 Tax=Dysidea avara TaxID=196820 RepID=UPI0033315449